MKVIRNYEDAYDGVPFDSFEELVNEIECVCGPRSPFAHYNVPVWINFDDEDSVDGVIEPPRVTVGIMLTRKGYSVQWYAPATEDQVMTLRCLMLSIWAGRADAGFARHSRELTPA